jgi:hypothetical protein
MPIAQSLRWFQISTGLGVADGDVVDYVLGAQTLKYLAKTVQSADNAAFLPYAIRYA